MTIEIPDDVIEAARIANDHILKGWAYTEATKTVLDWVLSKAIDPRMPTVCHELQCLANAAQRAYPNPMDVGGYAVRLLDRIDAKEKP